MIFRTGRFKLRSGSLTTLKIDCGGFSDQDWASLARLIGTHYVFSEVEGVPTGGLQFAAELEAYTSEEGGLLIVDDVFTTGARMMEQRGNRQAQGFVVFARGPRPIWIDTLFELKGQWAWKK